jgi:hypothetical protein
LAVIAVISSFFITTLLDIIGLEYKYFIIILAFSALLHKEIIFSSIIFFNLNISSKVLILDLQVSIIPVKKNFTKYSISFEVLTIVKVS